MTELLIRERPMLFSAPMMLAILAGTKTQTRRALSSKLIINDEPDRYKFHYYGECDGFAGLGACFEDLRPEITPWIMPIKCPYGEPSERIWVRETWRRHFHGRGGFNAPGVMYQADNAMRWVPEAGEFSDKTWIPSIHMYRWASRLLLEIVSVRVERLQDISEADAVAEGIEATQALGEPAYRDYLHGGLVEPIKSYRTLWEKINGSDSWASNPWVWVVEFNNITNA